MPKTTTLAVITGEHSFDVPNFHRLFRTLGGIDAYIQHVEHFASSPHTTRDAYDAVLYYNMHRETPDDTGPWFAGKPKSAIVRVLERGQGVTVLHHGLLAFPSWGLWDDWAERYIVGRRAYQGVPVQHGEIESFQAVALKLLVIALIFNVSLLLLLSNRLRRGVADGK